MTAERGAIDTAEADLVARLGKLSPASRMLLLARLGLQPRPLRRDGRPLPASFIQERLWLVDQLDPGGSSYLIPVAIRVSGALDTKKFRAAFDAVVERHEVLRTSLVWTEGGLTQVVHPSVPSAFELIDLSAGPDVRGELDRLLAQEAVTGFNLASAPLLRLRLVRIAPHDHVIVLVLHHAITDGWSTGLLLRELGQLYTTMLCGESVPEPPARLQYADAVAWQRAQLTERHTEQLTAYWRDRLIGAPDPFPLPADRPRTPRGARRGGYHQIQFPSDLIGRVRQLCRTERVTPFIVLLGGFAAALSRWSGESDVVIGNPYAGRTHSALENVLGPFVNTIVLRIDMSRSPTFRDVLRRAGEATLGAHAHADLPFERVVKALSPRRDSRYNPIFQVNLALADFPHESLNLPPAVTEPVEVPDVGTAKFDLSLYVIEATGRWYGTVEYDATLFDHPTIERFADGLRSLLSAALAAPDAIVDDLPIAELSAPRSASSRPPDRSVNIGGEERFVAPRDRWEWATTLAWAEVLQRQRISVTDDFFGLGGDSMAAMLALGRLRKLTGQRVSLAVLFEHSTVEAFAAAMASQADEGHPSFVVTLRSGGERPPLFLTHAAVGELTMYFELARALEPERGIYGVQPDGFLAGGAQGRLTLPEMARQYAEEIRTVYPDGPVHLCGFSAAGRIAVAVADQLSELKVAVGAVILLDTAPLGDIEPDPDRATILARWLPFAPAEELRALEPDEQLERVLESGKRAGEISPHLQLDQFRWVCDRLELTARALTSYVRPSYPGTITVFTRRESPRDLGAEWAAFPVGAVTVETLPVESHLGFVHGPAVDLVAERVSAQLRLAESGVSGSVG